MSSETQKAIPILIRITASWFSIGFLLAACGRQPVADSRFTDAAISLRFPTDWSLANAAPDFAAPKRGVTIQKGNFLISVEGAPYLQASGVDGGRIYEYLNSSVVDVACLFEEGSHALLNSPETTPLPNGVAIVDYYLDTAQLGSAERHCVRAQIPESGVPYAGSSSTLMGEAGREQTRIRFYTSRSSSVYVRGDPALTSALQEMRRIASTFMPMFDPARRTHGASIVAELRRAGFRYSLYDSDEKVYPGYESGIYYTCPASDRGYSDYVTSFTESIKPEDLPKLLGVLKTNGWEKCRTAAVDVYIKNGEILNVVTMTRTGNTTVIVPWALRVLANEK